MRKKIDTAKNVAENGLVNRGSILPSVDIKPDRNWASAIGDSTKPITKGPNGNFARSIRNPTTPNISITYTSKKLFETAKIPMMQNNRIADIK